MYIFRVILFVFLLYTPSLIKEVQADSFYPAGDTLTCKMATTFALGYSSGSMQGINYNPDDIVGNSKSYLMGRTIHEMANVRAGSLERYANIGTNVAIPPGYSVEMLFYVYNFSGHSIRGASSWLYFSDSRNSEIDSLIDVDVRYWSQVYLSRGILYSKKGVSTKINLHVGNIMNTTWNGVPRGKALASWNIVQPISIDNIQAVCHADGADISAEIRNTGNVSEEVIIGTERYSIPSKDTKDIHFFAEAASFDMVVQNREVCFGNNHVNGQESPKDHTFFLLRNDYNYWIWSALQTDIPVVNDSTPYCIKRIDYSITEEIPACLDPEPKLILKKPQDEIKIFTGEEFTFNIPIRNVGGNMLEEEVVEVRAPEWINVNILSDSNILLDSKESSLVEVSFSIPKILFSEYLGVKTVCLYTAGEIVGCFDIEIIGSVSTFILEFIYKSNCIEDNFGINVNILLKVSGDTFLPLFRLPISVLNASGTESQAIVEVIDSTYFHAITIEGTREIQSSSALSPGEYEIDLRIKSLFTSEYSTVILGDNKYSVICNNESIIERNSVINPNIVVQPSIRTEMDLSYVTWRDTGDILETKDDPFAIEKMALGLPKTGTILQRYLSKKIQKAIIELIATILLLFSLQIALRHIARFVRQH